MGQKVTGYKTFKKKLRNTPSLTTYYLPLTTLFSMSIEKAWIPWQLLHEFIINVFGPSVSGLSIETRF
jgi:hypothetical protein